MSALALIEQETATYLADETFADLSCSSYGIVVFQGASSWGAHESGLVEVPTPGGMLTIPVAYDERGGPYAIERLGSEQPDLLFSLTDEDDYLACAWARTTPGSPLMGLGIDLSTAARFAPREGRKDYFELLFTEHEKELMPQVDDDRLMARAKLFSAKEAAFKSTARPLRDWYQTHDDELLYEVRHYVMSELGTERGEGRNGAAQAAMDRMGIGQVKVRWTQLRGMALVTAVALKR